MTEGRMDSLDPTADERATRYLRRQQLAQVDPSLHAGEARSQKE